MRDVVSNLVYLILEVSSKVTPDIINKSLEISEVLLEKNFEVRLRDRSGTFVPVFILSLSEIDNATKIWSGKQSVIHFGGIWCFEIILTLLKIVVTVYIRFSQVTLQSFSLK